MVESNVKLTKKETETLYGLSNYLTISKIAKYQKCSRQAIYKRIKKLLRIGFIEKIGLGAFRVTEKGKEGLHSVIGLSGKIRIHDLAIKIFPMETHKNWELKRAKIMLLPYFNKRIALNNTDYDILSMGNIKIKITPKSLILWLPMCLADTPEDAMSQEMDILFDVLPKIEQRFKIKLIKEGKMNMEIINQNYARLQDALAKLYRMEGNKLLITDEKGELRVIADCSFNTDETETVHTKYAGDDMAALNPFMLDLLNNPTTFSEVKDMIAGVTKNQLIFDANMKSHLEVLNKIGNAINQLTGEVKKVRELKKQLKYGIQTNLGDFYGN